MTELNRESFNTEVVKDIPLVVDFWAGWCMPCKVFAPVVEEVANELDGKAMFGKVDVDSERELAMEYDIVSIPTLVIFKSGKESERLVGLRRKEEVTAAVKRHID